MNHADQTEQHEPKGQMLYPVVALPSFHMPDGVGHTFYWLPLSGQGTENKAMILQVYFWPTWVHGNALW